MALINFKWNIGETPEDSSDKKKETELNDNLIKDEKEGNGGNNKTDDKYNNLYLKEVEYKIKEKEDKLKQLDTDIIKRKNALKKLDGALLKRKDILHELEENILEKESLLTNLEEKILEGAGSLKDIEKNRDIDINPMIIKELKNRRLENIYSIVFIDITNLKFRKEGRKISKYIYSVIGVNVEGKREVIGIWIHNKDLPKYWAEIFEEIKNRGVDDILIISTPLIEESNKEILKVFPKSEIEMSILDEMRNSNKYVNYKDLKAFNKDLRKIYLASTKDIALEEFQEIDNKWGDKYPVVTKLWEDKLRNLDTVFKYPEEIREVLYGSNILKVYNGKINKITKKDFNTFSNKEILDGIYLEANELYSRWSKPIRNWNEVLSKIFIVFPNRIKK